MRELVTLFSVKVRRYGVIGAGVISDPLTAFRVREICDQLAQASAAAGAENDRSSTLVVPPLKPGEPLTRDHVLMVLKKSVEVQAIVQEEISTLARKLVNGKSDKKKRKQPLRLKFLDAYQKIGELGLPRDPVEDVGLTEVSFQQLLLQYETDAEVMQSAQQLLHPTSKGNMQRAKEFSVEQVIDVHQFMVIEMEKVVDEFRQIPPDVRRTFTGKGCETTAELLVSMAVEQNLSVRCEDVEQAVILKEEHLQQIQEFSRCTDRLAELMQTLIGAVQPSLDKEQFLASVRHAYKVVKEGKVLIKKLHEEYRAKRVNIKETYRRYNEWYEQTLADASASGITTLSAIEMDALCEAYSDDTEVRRVFQELGLAWRLPVNGQLPLEAQDTKGRKSKNQKPSEIVDMQVVWVGELRKIVGAVRACVKADSSAVWKPDVTVEMANYLAEAEVEKKYGISAEEMSKACSNLAASKAAIAQRSERFMKSNEEKAELLMELSKLCSGEK